MAVDAVALGISYDDYWSLSPLAVMELCEEKIRQKESEIDEKLFTSWLTSYYTSVGFNSPKKFPKKPSSLKDMNKTEEEKLEELAASMMNLKGKKFSNIKKVTKDKHIRKINSNEQIEDDDML